MLSFSIALQMADAQARGENVLFSFEEAIGFCCGSVVRDKDGVSAAAVFAEMAQVLGRKGLSVSSHLDTLYEKYGWFTSANFYVFVDTPAKTDDIFERLRNDGHYWARLGYVTKS
jgi:phosphomannomutase